VAPQVSVVFSMAAPSVSFSSFVLRRAAVLGILSQDLGICDLILGYWDKMENLGMKNFVVFLYYSISWMLLFEQFCSLHSQKIAGRFARSIFVIVLAFF
jgi:hypothetical protein